MSTAKTPDDRLRPLQPLQYNLALLAHLIYLARRSESNQQQRYLDWASEVIEETERHPKLHDEPASRQVGGKCRNILAHDTGALASNGIMHCAEYQQLEHAYTEAVRRWSQYASPQTVVLPGKDQLQRATALRQDALVERNSAANALHLHRRQCLVCKREGAA